MCGRSCRRCWPAGLRDWGPAACPWPEAPFPAWLQFAERPVAAQVSGESRPVGGCPPQELPTAGHGGRHLTPSLSSRSIDVGPGRPCGPTLQVNSRPPSSLHLGLALDDPGREDTLNCCPATWRNIWKASPHPLPPSSGETHPTQPPSERARSGSP